MTAPTRERSAPSPAPGQQLTDAGVVSRCAAATVDLSATVGTCAGVYLMLSGLLFLVRPASFSFPSVGRGLILLVGAAVLAVYLTATWALSGRTIGNELLGLRVVDSGGRRLGLLRATVRALAYVGFPVGLFLCATRRRRSLQDIVLRTRVVYDWGHGRPAVASPAARIPRTPRSLPGPGSTDGPGVSATVT